MISCEVMAYHSAVPFQARLFDPESISVKA